MKVNGINPKFISIKRISIGIFHNFCSLILNYEKNKWLLNVSTS